MEKPSQKITEIRDRLKKEFDEKNPYYFLDNGYYPDFWVKAILEYLDSV